MGVGRVIGPVPLIILSSLLSCQDVHATQVEKVTDKHYYFPISMIDMCLESLFLIWKCHYSIPTE